MRQVTGGRWASNVAVATALGCVVGVGSVMGGGCASGEGNLDGSTGMDADLPDGAPRDATGGMMDALPPDDAGDPMDDAGADGGPPERARTCESCEDHDDCRAGSFCVPLTVGGRACVPGCVPDIPTCPRSFSCVLDIASGVDTTVCLPIGGACCVDEDADMHGQGVGCMGPDCNDLDETINPAADELCDGIDNDCDGTPDDPPTDCLSGRCANDGDGTYTAVTGASCMDAVCAEGTVTDCMAFTCVDGGENGNTCATSCSPDGTEDDAFCVEGAHCTGGTCVPDIPDGGACVQDSDCVSAYCDNGFCCGSGTCCNTTADCPGGGGVTALCDDAEDCQGTRGETTCTAAFRCMTTSGIDDDSACDTDTLARDCSPYLPVYCTGAATQTAPRCPTSCLGDEDCVEAAHCEGGFCVGDRPAGNFCSRNGDCQTGLTCVDNTCCTTPCTGSCRACDLPGSAGTCVNVPSGSDIDFECNGFSCADFYDGFGSGENSCFRRQNVSDAAATCNGGGACTDPATACSTQPRASTPQITCNGMCQTPTAGTCNGMTPGACTNLDDPAITTTCGVGACARTVQRCTGGSPTSCTPGTPIAETCNGIDDNCNGVLDDGPSAALCPPPMVGVATECNAGSCRLASCPPGSHDVDSNYTNGCECSDDAAGNTCASALNIGTLTTPGSSMPFSGKIIPGTSDWVSVSFPTRSNGGAPRLALTHSGGGANPFRMAIYGSCAGVPGSPLGNCNTAGDAGNAGAVTSWDFRDNASFGLNAYSTADVSWPTTVLVQITRTSNATTCGAATYTLTASR